MPEPGSCREISCCKHASLAVADAFFFLLGKSTLKALSPHNYLILSSRIDVEHAVEVVLSRPAAPRWPPVSL